MYYHWQHMRTVKAERLQIRVDSAEKALLEQAAAASHLNISSFVVQAAASRAEEVLAQRATIHLSPQAAVEFTRALQRPAEVNAQLLETLSRSRGVRFID